MPAYDNRTFLDKAAAGSVQKLVDRLTGQGAPHFRFELGGKSIGYCYIRKNGCSNFKQAIIAESPNAKEADSFSSEIDFLIKHHLMRNHDAAECDRIVFVYRDPVERFLSMFRNKFIQRDGYEDLFGNYEQLTGQPAPEASFTDVVAKYLPQPFAKMDPHFWRQKTHLKRFRYTDALPMAEIHEGMRQIVGDELAAQYFQKPVNTSASSQDIDDTDAATASADELHKVYAANNEMPSKASLLKPELEQKIRARYSDDYGLIASV